MSTERSVLFARSVDDSAYDGKVECEKGADCTDPDCMIKKQRTAFRYTLGTIVEAMQGLVLAQKTALDLWGECKDPQCTFEARLQHHLTETGLSLGQAFTTLCFAVEMWKALPEDWHFRELDGADDVLQAMEVLNHLAADQATARKEGTLGTRPN